jgi:hypothetical protein
MQCSEEAGIIPKTMERRDHPGNEQFATGAMSEILRNAKNYEGYREQGCGQGHAQLFENPGDVRGIRAFAPKPGELAKRMMPSVAPKDNWNDRPESQTGETKAIMSAETKAPSRFISAHEIYRQQLSVPMIAARTMAVPVRQTG